VTDTIFAPATAPGRAAVAVVRLSGPGTKAALTALAGPAPRPRTVSIRTIIGTDGVAIDQGLVVWFPAPRSYTGEDAAELQVHGSPAVMAAVVEALSGLSLRLAAPGEFTRRAFENGKLDLAQAEGVADLIDAETEAQRRQALAQLGGRLSGAQARWRAALTEALGYLEAAIDFPDEDLPANVAARARPGLEALLDELGAAMADAERGERVRAGYRIALIGAPNAGKSTLLNVLAGREAAIVTATPGTTRDVVEVPLVLAGFKVLLADTAGLRETEEEIEAEGVRRARAWAEGADLRLWVVDGASDIVTAPPDELRAGDLCLVAKRDLGMGEAGRQAAGDAERLGLPVMAVTARGPNDMAWLRSTLEETVTADLAGAEPPAATRLRHRALLGEARARIAQALAQDSELELAAEDVRLAARALDRITGHIHPEDVLGQIFATFCIGK
jgi:tRNA modification GTPase